MPFSRKSFPVAVALLCLGAISPSLPIFAQTEESQNQSTSEPLLSVEGTLEPGDATLEDGSLYDIYSFEGRAGQTVTIVLESLEFDTYLLLLDPQGEKIGENDDVSEGSTNSVITITVPKDGAYRVLVNAYDAQGRGQYALKVVPVLPGQEQKLFSGATNRLDEANRLNQQGVQQWATSQFQAARQSFEQALAIYQEIGDRAEEGRSLNNLGRVYNDQGQYKEALEYYQRALAIVQEIGDREGEGTALGNLGYVYDDLGQYPEAIEYYQQALAIRREVRDRVGEGATLNNLGLVYNNLGQYEEAIEYYQQALVIAEEVGDRAEEGATLNNLGLVYNNLGQYEEAIEYYQQALAIKREVGDRATAGKTLNNLGLVYNNLGQYPKALESYRQALTIFQEVGDRATEGYALNNLGFVYHDLGQYEEAIEYYQQALAIHREVGNRPMEGTALNNLGGIYSDLGQYNEALESYQQALVIVQEVGKRAREGTTFNNLGGVYQDMEQYEEALEYYQQALVIHREVGDRPMEGTNLNNLGGIYSDLGQYNEALEFYQQALAIAQEVGNRAGEGTILHNLGLVYDDLRQYAEAEQKLYAAIEIRESLRSSELSDADKISLFDTQADTYRLLQQVLITQNKTDRALEIAERGRARALVELLSRQLNPQSKELPQIDPPSLAEIKQIAQQQNATLVQYSVIPNIALFIWVIQPTGNVEFRAVDLDKLDGSPISIDELNRLRRTLEASRGGKPEDSALASLVRGTETALQGDRVSFQKHLQQLHQLLIDPIAEFLPSNPEDRVIFIPHESLFRVPFAALQDAEFNYLIEKHTILTAPSIQSLTLTRQHKERIGETLPPETGNRETLIVGNPIIPDLLTQDPYNLKPLQFAKKEAQEIAKILNAAPPLLGNAATETEVVKRLHSAHLIHLATHGLFETNELRDRVPNLNIPGLIALTPDSSVSPLARGTEGGSENDGFLTAGELVQLTHNNPLNADLVVLSACETGLGDITGDGVIGLSRSLIAAGVPSIVVSLWQVPDDSTRKLMTAFYTNLYEKNMDKATALRQAMLAMMEENPDPGDWSGFTLIGEAE